MSKFELSEPELYKEGLLPLLAQAQESPHYIKEKKNNMLSIEKEAEPDIELVQPFIFRRAQTKNDVTTIVEIGDEFFGPSEVPSKILVNILYSWLQENPDVLHVLEANDGLIIGYSSILPLIMEKIGKILRSEEHPSLITPDDILPFESGRPLNLYVHEVVTRPSLTKKQKRTAGMRLLSGLMDRFEDLGRQGVEIQGVYARSNKEDDIALSENLGFGDVVPAPGVTKRVFQLDVNVTESAFLSIYRRALEQGRHSRTTPTDE